MNASPQYLAFDLGASSGRAVLGTLAEGRMQMEELHRFETPLIEEGEHLFWDLETLWEELRRGLHLALEAAPKLRSLSVDSWAVDYVPLDAEGQPLRNPYSYRDPRTEGVMERAFEQVPAARLYEITGIQFLPFNTLYQLLADKEAHPDLHENTRLRLPIADYFNHCFGGRAAVDESMASTTQLMDVRRFAWATDLMDAFGLDPEGWPEIVPCGTRLGSVRLRDVPLRSAEMEVIASCSHDTACAIAAVPTESSSDWAYLSSGTWSLLGVERGEPLLTDEAREAGFTNEVGLGGTIRFLKNLTGLWPLQECVREWREAGEEVAYDTLQAEAEAARPGLAQIDLEDERFRARGGMEKRLKHYCRETEQPVPETRGQLVRVILESLAASYRRALDALETLTDAPVETLHIVGGGAQNNLLCQLTADACACRVVAGPVEATALGNLAVQAHAMGDLPEGRTVRDLVRRSTDPKTYVPDPTTA